MMNRFEKMEFISETSAINRKTIMEEMVSWMTEEQFNDFYEYFCSNWDICRSQQELNQKYGAEDGENVVIVSKSSLHKENI